jgi:hypothetical protein
MHVRMCVCVCVYVCMCVCVCVFERIFVCMSAYVCFTFEDIFIVVRVLSHYCYTTVTLFFKYCYTIGVYVCVPVGISLSWNPLSSLSQRNNSVTTA